MKCLLPACGLFLALLLGATPPARLATLTVTNTNDSGAGSFRQAILDSNASVGTKDTIAFNIPGAGPFEIVLASALPVIVDPVTIDGFTQPATFPYAQIVLNGAAVPAPDAVLTLSAGSSTIKALTIVDGNDAGIRIQTNGGNLIQSCLIGAVNRGPQFPPRSNAGPGVDIVSGVANTIQACFIVFNGGPGIVVGTGASRVEYLQNLIYSNDGIAVDLGGDGRTPNDVGDGDTGGNTLLNFPVLETVVVTNASNANRSITITGHLDAAPSTTYGLRFYFGKPGKIKDDISIIDNVTITTSTLTTDGTGHAVFSYNTSYTNNVPNSVIAAATLDTVGNMSELSVPIELLDLSVDSGCGACGLEWLIVPALVALRRRLRRRDLPSTAR